MKYYFSEEQENLFVVSTMDSLDGVGVGGKDYINMMPSNASSRIGSVFVYNQINPYYCDYTVAMFNRHLSKILHEEDMFVYVERKKGISDIVTWIKECRPHLIFENTKHFSKIKLKSVVNF